jgi:predicted DNA-binding transcriptional regulator YafY
LGSSLRAAGFPITERSVQRDLLVLREQFPALECDDTSKPHRWRWSSAAAKSAVAGMSTLEALSLELVRQHLLAALPASMLDCFTPLFERASAQLARHGPRDGSRTWLQKLRVLPSGLSTGPAPEPAPDAAKAVSEALMHNRQLRIVYQRGAGGPTKAYELAPLGLLLRGGVRYLVGVLGRGQHRYFALHRVRQAEVLPTLAHLPAGLSLDSVLAQSGGQFGVAPDAPPIRLVLRCDAELAAVLDESPLAADQQLNAEPEGRTRLTATLPAGWELRWWLLSHLEQVEVVEPLALRIWIQQTLSEALARHR